MPTTAAVAPSSSPSATRLGFRTGSQPGHQAPTASKNVQVAVIWPTSGDGKGEDEVESHQPCLRVARSACSLVFTAGETRGDRLERQSLDARSGCARIDAGMLRGRQCDALGTRQTSGVQEETELYYYTSRPLSLRWP